MSLMKEWFTLPEVAAMALPGLPATKQGMQALAERAEWPAKTELCRDRQGRGGGTEYHYALLPCDAQANLTMQLLRIEEASERATAKAKLTREEMWAWFDRLPERKKDKARDKLQAIETVRALVRNGVDKVVAADMIARRHNVAKSSFYNWEACIYGVERHDWLPYLAPRHAGSSERTDCSAQAWEFLKSDYLRPEKPSFLACYRRLERTAKAEGWTVPSPRTLLRRIDELPEPLRVLAREGTDALKALYPAQTRDRSVFHALEAVNADGHKWDVFVRWPDGYVGRPMMVAFQDLYSGKMLAWRIDKSENRAAVRLAFGDLVQEFGIPDQCWLDNGRAFASKWMTGGTPNRFRFKLKDDEPVGLMTQVGVNIHWTTPYHGQAKPIERAFRDFAGDTAKHPKFAGAYTGNDPLAKPENYGSKAVPLDVFLAVVHEAVIEHNARVGRRTRVCAGRSFDDVFAESYAKSPIRKATAEQHRLWLLAAEAIRVSPKDGVIELLGNRFWAEFLHEFRGKRVVARFDPEALQLPLHVYRLDGAYLGAAACKEAVGFNDMQGAQDHNRARNAWRKGQRQMLDAERKLSIREVAELLPEADEPAPLPAAKVVRLVRGSGALQPIHDRAAEETEDAVFSALAQMRAARAGGAHLHVVNPDQADD